MSTQTGVAPVKEMRLGRPMTDPAGVMTSSPGPMPRARMPSSRADMPESSPMACSTPQYRANSSSKAATSPPSMKSAFSITLRTAACTSAPMAACWAFRSTRGSFPSMRLRRSPDVWPLVKAFEADEVGDCLHAHRGVAGYHRPCLDVLGHHAARADQRTSADSHARQKRCVGADAHVILDWRAEHTLQIAWAHRVRVVGENDMGPEKHAIAQRRVFEKATAVNARAAAD